MRMSSVSKLQIGLVCFIATMLSATAFAETVKVGVVDMQRAIQGVESGKKAKSQLEKEFNARRAELQKEEASIKKMGEEFRKQSLVLNDEARSKKQAELQERVMKFQELTARSQQEIAQKEQELTLPIVQKLRSIISELAKKKEYSVILEKNENTVLFSLEKDDLTEEVIKAFNSASKG
ncbi:OmpH family outer membrane protein [bacterium]|nr:OmpH family outer membrane protein [bacterium]